MHERPRRIRTTAKPRARLALVCCLGTGMAQAGSPTPPDAEYAIRWDPAAGGPAAAEQVLALLGLTIPPPEFYRVRYYDLPQPATAPARAAVILRGRTKLGGKTQIRLKYRLEQPLTGPWACPPGSPFEPSSEVDVTWLPSGPPQRLFAYSCTLKAAAPPLSLSATPKPCGAEMTRYTAGGFKVETWRMPQGEAQLEVSRTEPDTPEALARFAAVAQRLIGQGAKPTVHSKTELGSACP